MCTLCKTQVHACNLEGHTCMVCGPGFWGNLCGMTFACVRVACVSHVML